MPIVTLFSNFSGKDLEIAIFKGHLTSALPDVSIVDIGHDAVFDDLWRSAYVLSIATINFPKDSVHVVMQAQAGHDCGYVALKLKQQWYIVPDNGLLPFAFGEQVTRANHLTGTQNSDWTITGEILVSTVVQIVAGNKLTGTPYKPLRSAPRLAAPRITGNRADCNILMADNFGNLVINIRQEMFSSLIGSRPFRIKLPGREDLTNIAAHYNEVPEGNFLCRFNKAGYLEIAINHGRAVDIFQTDAKMSRNIHYQYISIEF